MFTFDHAEPDRSGTISISRITNRRSGPDRCLSFQQTDLARDIARLNQGLLSERVFGRNRLQGNLQEIPWKRRCGLQVISAVSQDLRGSCKGSCRSSCRVFVDFSWSQLFPNSFLGKSCKTCQKYIKTHKNCCFSVLFEGHRLFPNSFPEQLGKSWERVGKELGRSRHVQGLSRDFGLFSWFLVRVLAGFLAAFLAV